MAAPRAKAAGKMVQSTLRPRSPPASQDAIEPATKSIVGAILLNQTTKSYDKIFIDGHTHSCLALTQERAEPESHNNSMSSRGHHGRS